jgi:hypothetical protein
MSGRLDSKFEAQGAEFLVLGHLLIEGIPTYKNYVNAPGYDLVAVNPEANRSARIQVKSRWATDFDGGFLIKNFECDFVVLVTLNRGYRYGKARNGSVEKGKQAPDFYVFPVEIAKAAVSEKSKWGKAFLRYIDRVEDHKGNWRLVRNFLGMEARPDMAIPSGR